MTGDINGRPVHTTRTYGQKTRPVRTGGVYHCTGLYTATHQTARNAAHCVRGVFARHRISIIGTFFRQKITTVIGIMTTTVIIAMSSNVGYSKL